MDSDRTRPGPPAPPDRGTIAGAPIALDGLNPLVIAEAGKIWLVTAGHVDVFVLPIARGRPAGPRRHLLRIESGQALLPLPTLGSGGESETRFLAVGTLGTEMVETRPERLGTLGADGLADLAQGWVATLTQAIAPAKSVWADRIVEAEGGVRLAAAERLYGHPRRVAWLTPRAGELTLFGEDGLRTPASATLPLVGPAWVTAPAEVDIEVESTAAVLARGGLWAAIERFNALAAERAARRGPECGAAERDRLALQAAARERGVSAAYSRLAALLVPGHRPAVTEDVGEPPLLASAKLVGEALGVDIAAPSSLIGDPDIAAIASSSRLRFRWVVLPDGWWRRDHGPLIGFLGEEARPVALLPAGPRRYAIADAAADRRPLAADLAAAVKREAVMLYRPMPDRAMSVPGLIRFGIRGVAADAALLLASGLMVGLLGLITPFLSGRLFGSIIPDTERGSLLQLSLGLVAVALGATAFQATQAIALLRFEGRLDWQIQSALFDRLLSLPAPFFRRFTSGDLADRALGLQAIRTILTGSLLTSLLSGMFGLVSFGLLLYYSARLALVAAGLVALSFAATAVFSHARLGHERAATERQGRVDGLVVQFLIGIAKLRVAAGESRAFAIWAKLFAEQKSRLLKGRRHSNRLATFDAAFPVFAALALFAAAGALLAEPPAPGGAATSFGIGDFLGFNAAFGQLLAAVTGLASALTSALGAVPLFERSAPILSCPGESAGGADPPGQLQGGVELSRVTFRYAADTPPILDGLSMRVEPGSFIAIVGPSGAGKSTIFRLLLGFEEAESGGIFYDGRSLASLDRAALRRQLGVVLQNGRITAGSIVSNIVGSARLSEADAWGAARLAGLEADIEAMPMGLHTVLGEGGATLSGGQRQRLMVARALVRKPRILLFDEATSALDNRTQAIVTESLAALSITRIVIAHRLSTIRGVDRIFVVDRGRVRQEGTFAELIAEPGPFAALASRQMV